MTFCSGLDPESRVIAYIAGLIACVLSLYGNSFILYSFLLHSKRRGSSSLIAILAVGGWGWSISSLWSFSVLLFFSESNLPEERCVGQRVSYQFFSMFCILWCTCIAWFLWYSVNKVMDISIYDSMVLDKKRTECTQVTPLMWSSFAILSVGIPIVLDLIYVKGKFWVKLPKVNMCVPNSTYHLNLWYVPNAVMYFIQVCLILVVTKRTISLKRQLQVWYPSFTVLSPIPVKLRLGAFVLVFLMCWTLDLIYWTIHYALHECHNFEFFLVYNFFINSHGFFNGIVYAITTGPIKRRFQKKPFISCVSVLFAPLIVPFAFFICICRRRERRDGEDPLLSRTAPYSPMLKPDGSCD